MSTINCTTLNASVAVNTANVNVSNTVISVNMECTDLVATGGITTDDLTATGTFTAGNIVANGLSLASLTVDQIATPLLQVDTIAGNLTPDEVIIQSGVTLRANDISGAIQTNFHKDIVMDETVPANIHVPSGSSIYTNSLIPNSGTVITCPNEINTLYLSATNSVITPLLLSLGGPDITVNANLVCANPNILNVDNISSPSANVIIDSSKVLQVQTITPQLSPLVFGGSIESQGNITVDAGATLFTDILNGTSGGAISVNQDFDMLSHDIQHCNAIQINTSNGGGDVQIHSQGGSTQCNALCDSNGDLIANNLSTTFRVGLLRPRYWQSSITLGVIQTTLAATTTVYSLLGSWGTPGGVGYGWTVDSPVTNSWRLTYNGTSSRAVKLCCDMTYSTSAADQFSLAFYKNATISGGNVISTTSVDGSFHRVNNTGLTLPRDSFQCITTVAPNDTFMIGVQAATVAGVVFQAISASWSIEDFSNGAD